jgi:hypothetical protein
VEPIDEAFLGLLTRVSEAIGSIGGGAPEDRPRDYLEIGALFDRCRSLLGAVRLLLRHGFAHESMMLGRPLLTDSLALTELASADERRRAELVVGWELASVADLRGIILEFQKQGGNVAGYLSATDTRRSQVEDYARARGLRAKHWRPDSQAPSLAKKHGRDGDAFDLRVLHSFVHGSTLATSQRYSQVAPDSVEIGGPAIVRDTWARASGLSAAHSALLAARAFCSIAEIAEPAEIAPLLAEVLAYQQTSEHHE